MTTSDTNPSGEGLIELVELVSDEASVLIATPSAPRQPEQIPGQPPALRADLHSSLPVEHEPTIELPEAEAQPPPLSQAAVQAEPSKTKIDLGEDLLTEKTVVLTAQAVTEQLNPEPNALETSAQNARILLSEGFPEEAKKILRQLLLQNKNNVEAQKLLEEIHHSELKQIFATTEHNTRKTYKIDRRQYDESILNVDSAELLKSLDKEFDIGIEPFQGPEVFLPQELEAASQSPSDRIDLAISFIEMELYAHANQLLRTLLKTENSSNLVAVSLLALSHLLCGQFYEVISVLQPYLNETDILKEDKIELFYLMGRAHLGLDKKGEALGWFLHVQSIDPRYRDLAERLKLLGHK